MKLNRSYSRYWPVVVTLLLGLLILSLLLVYRDKFHKPPQTKKIIQQVTIIQAPPPPPPPPEQQLPEPELKEEQVDTPEPIEKPEPAPVKDEQPAAKDLGLDTDGVAGTDGFGLIGNKGGRSILGGNGSGGSAILWYGGQIQRQIEAGLQTLLADTPAMQAGISVILEVWIAADGQISRCQLAVGSAKPEVDQAIKSVLPKLRINLDSAPPAAMQQPVKLRITPRM